MTTPGVSKPPRQVRESGPTGQAGQSWLSALDGGIVVWLLLVGALGYAMAGRLLAGLRITYDQFERPIIETTTNVHTYVGLGFFGLACVLSLFLAFAVRPGRAACAFVLLVQALVVWWAVMSVVVPRTSGIVPVLTLGALPLVLAVAAAPPSDRSLRLISISIDIFAVCHLAYSYLNPELAQFPCRSDKCGVLGSMYSGFFTQENVAPEIMALFLPAAVAARSGRRCAVSLGLAAIVALTSGSRTGLLSVATSIACVLIVRHLVTRRPVVRVAAALLWLPLVTCVVSLAVFLLAAPEALTGRGVVYRAIREALTGPALLYGVDWDVVQTATDGYLAGEHGQASHIVARAGVVGLAIWLLALYALPRVRMMDRSRLIGLSIMLTATVGMVTEPRFELDARSPSFAVLLLTVGLMAVRLPGRLGRERGWSPPGWRRGTLVASACILAGGLPLVLPTVYVARTVVFVDSPSDAPRQLIDSYTVALAKTVSYAEVARSTGIRATLVQRLGLDTTPAGVAPALELRHDDRQTVMRLEAENVDAVLAARLADEWSRSLVTKGRELESRGVDAPASATVRDTGSAYVVPKNPWLAYAPIAMGFMALAVVLSRLRALAPKRARHATADRVLGGF